MILFLILVNLVRAIPYEKKCLNTLTNAFQGHQQLLRPWIYSISRQPASCTIIRERPGTLSRWYWRVQPDTQALTSPYKLSWSEPGEQWVTSRTNNNRLP